MEKVSGIKELWEAATNAWTLGSAGSVYLALRLVGRVVHTSRRVWLALLWQRSLTVMPEIIAISAALLGWIPSLSEKSVELKIAGGLWIAYLSTKAKKIIGQTLLGDDAKIESLMRGGNSHESANEHDHS